MFKLKQQNVRRREVLLILFLSIHCSNSPNYPNIKLQ